MKKKITIYTDGSCSPNPGKGGWAAILIYKHNEKVISGNQPDTSNQRMELTAVVQALRQLKYPCEVELITDSRYVQQGISDWIYRWLQNGWKNASKRPVANQDLWKELLAEIDRHDITWLWTRGHALNYYNNRVDELAVAARNDVK